MINIDRRAFIASLGGAAAVSLMSHEAKAEALEHYLEERLHAQLEDVAQSGGAGAQSFPSTAELHDAITDRHFRRGVGSLFLNTQAGGKVSHLTPMPETPNIFDFFELRFMNFRDHCYQSANKAMERGVDEEIILACLLHDVVQSLMRTDHGWWGAQMFEPYVPERTAFAIRYHAALRFYDDPDAGYQYPDLYYRMFGHDYVPPPYIQAAYEFTRKHRWYDAPREVTVSDLYAFDPNAVVHMDQFVEIVNRHFKHPKEGLGYDDSPSAHMWRSLANPDAPL
jgi:hypothetical protein